MKKTLFIFICLLTISVSAVAQKVTGVWVDVKYDTKIDYNRKLEQEVTFSWATLENVYQQTNLNYIVGCRFNPYVFWGAETGLDFEVCHNKDKIKDGFLPAQILSIPLCMHIRAYFTKTRWSPFISLSGGCRFSIPKKIGAYQGNEYLEFAETLTYGAVQGMFELMPGVSYRHSNDLAFNFQVGLVGGSVWCEVLNGSDKSLSENNYQLDLAHGFAVKLGVTF